MPPTDSPIHIRRRRPSQRRDQPRLQLTAPAVRRDRDCVQIGVTPEAGVVLAGLTPAEVRLLLRLHRPLPVSALRRSAAVRGSGPSNRPATPGVPAAAPPSGPDRVDQLVRLLRDRGLLTDERTAAPAGSRRSEATVLVTGAGDLTGLIGQTLRAGGVGRVETGDLTASRWAGRLVGGPDAEPGDEPGSSGVSGQDGLGHNRREPATRPDLVLLVAELAVDAASAEIWRRSSITHLPVVRTGRSVSLGPAVLPGGPCLTCMDLHRTDRDRLWPSVRGQLLASGGNPPPLVSDPATAAVAAGWAAMMAFMHLDGIAVPRGLCVEVSFGQLAAAPRRWSPHPRCGCWAPKGQ